MLYVCTITVAGHVHLVCTLFCVVCAKMNLLSFIQIVQRSLFCQQSFQHGFAQICPFHYLIYKAVVYCALLFVSIYLHM